MSKTKYLVFKNNMMPRLLTNPSQSLLDSFPKDQVIKNPKLDRFKGMAVQYLVLEDKVIRKASKEELGKINHILDKGESQVIENERNNMKEQKAEIEAKFKEIMEMVEDQSSKLELIEKENKKLKTRKSYGKVAFISILLNISSLLWIFKDKLV